MNSDWVAVLALVVSIGTFVYASVRERKAKVASIRPLLVFLYDGESGWYLKNVGQGPALNVILSHKSKDDGDWITPVRVPPVRVMNFL